MKIFAFLSKATVGISLVALTLITGCKKEPDFIPAPELSTSLPNEGKDTITLGNTVTLRPQLNTKDALTYSWTLNGENIGTDSILSFQPKTRGDYQVVFKAANAGGEATANYQIHVWGKYENGFFLVNEGWFGHGTGTVGFYRYNTGLVEDSVFTKENPGKTLEPANATLSFGTIYKEQLYLVTKVGGAVVVADAYSLKEVKRIEAKKGNDWRAFVGIDDNRGLLSASKGVYLVDLNTLEVGTQISGITGQVGDMIKAGNYVFVLSQTDGVVILNASTLGVVKKIAAMQVAFAKTKDGAIWAAGAKLLTRIDPATLEVTQIDVPFTVSGSWGAWHPGSITASTTDNSVYFAKNGAWAGGKEIYKYSGNVSSLATPFVTIPADKEFYGKGLGFDVRLNQLVVQTVKSGYGDNYSVNDIYMYNPQTGAQIKNVNYTGFYFPSVPVFHF